MKKSVIWSIITWIRTLFGPFGKMKCYKLRHLSIGKVKMLDKNIHNHIDFKIVTISWDVHWQTNLYLTVIIRDYLRFFINNTLAIGNCVLENKDLQVEEVDDDDWNNWKRLVNSVADEFDEMLQIGRKIECTESLEERTDLQEKEKALLQKAFSDLAYIYDDLCW